MNGNSNQGEIMRHAIVAIGFRNGQGYRMVIDRYATRAEALADILGRSARSYSLVYRDGTTGQRFSFNECRSLR